MHALGLAILSSWQWSLISHKTHSADPSAFMGTQEKEKKESSVHRWINWVYGKSVSVLCNWCTSMSANLLSLSSNSSQKTAPTPVKGLIKYKFMWILCYLCGKNKLTCIGFLSS
jgi:hypothetical protein